jgi:hypothetical protein
MVRRVRGKVLHVVVERAALLRVEVGELGQVGAVFPFQIGGQFGGVLKTVERRLFLQRAGEVGLHHRIRGRCAGAGAEAEAAGLVADLGPQPAARGEAGGDHEGRERSEEGREGRSWRLLIRGEFLRIERLADGLADEGDEDEDDDEGGEGGGDDPGRLEIRGALAQQFAPARGGRGQAEAEEVEGGQRADGAGDRERDERDDGRKRTFGRIWLKMMRGVEAPSTCAACT